MVNIGNFVWSTVATPPSPAASGTTITVESGDGAKFASVGFPCQATVGPRNAAYSAANAEIVTILSRSGDTLTVTRSQESTTARTITAGDRIAVSITAGVLNSLGSGGGASSAATLRQIDQRRGGALDVVGIFGELSLQDMRDFKAAGGNAIVVQAFWDRLQSAQGGAVSSGEITNIEAHFSNAATAGLTVVFECALQYPPAWAKTAIPKFKDQNNTEWSTGDSGRDVRDWVWSSVGWTAVQDFITKVWNALSPTSKTQIETIRTGFGYYGETQFPPVGGGPEYQFWGFSDAAKGTGLAADQTANPRPSLKPFSSGSSDSDNIAFTNWYRNSAATRMRGLTQLYRNLGWTGKIHVLHPSWGVRSNWTMGNAGWQEQNAQGVDWFHQMTNYTDDNVWPWSTHVAADDYALSVTPGDWAPWRYLADCAMRAGRYQYLWGENTGGENNSAMEDMFEEGAMAKHYKGLFWLNWDSLNAGGGNAALITLKEQLELLRLAQVQNDASLPNIIVSSVQPSPISSTVWVTP